MTGVSLSGMQAEPVNARAVYAALNVELVPAMRALGYRRHGSGSGWIRRHGTQYLAAGASASRWGWNPWLGSSFFWTYSLASTAKDTRFANEATFWGLGDLLDDDELLAVQARIKLALRALPPPEAVPEDDYYRSNRSTWGLFLDMRKPPQLPSLQNEAELRFYTLDHVRVWGAWLASRATDLEDRLSIHLPHADTD